ncbi:uncharacterized protein [Ptychodera flava]|uniref:uncharacterized protein n=1 Tax=Ptychodera flava TaxID=63121 RepID=UPI003969C404
MFGYHQEYRDLLIGAESTIYTDNNPFSYLLTTAKLGATDTRWAAELAQFNFSVKYRSGKSNKNADALSRKRNHTDQGEYARLEETHVDIVTKDTLSARSSTAVPKIVRMEGREVNQLILSSSLNEKVLNAVHDSVGNQCAEKTTALVRNIFTGQAVYSCSRKKQKWPEHLSEIVYAYNITPHSSTGYSPHYLFFGRQPTLQIDHLLGSEACSSTESQMDERVIEHQKRLNEAFEAASQNTEKEAKRRRDRNDATDNTDLPIDTIVFSRNRAIGGGNKVQGRWSAEPHRAIKRLDTRGHTYTFEPFSKELPVKTVNRCELLAPGV